jgi:hypothetical protein
MADGDIHVVENGNEWTLTIEGVQRDLLSLDTEEEAVRTARRLAECAHCEAVIHGDVPLVDETPV